MGSIQRDRKGKDSLWTAHLTVNQHVVEFLLDTGAEANVIDKATWHRIKGGKKLRTGSLPLVSFTQTPLKSIGHVNLLTEKWPPCMTS